MWRDVAIGALRAVAHGGVARELAVPLVVLLGSMSCGARSPADVSALHDAFEGSARELDDAERAALGTSWRVGCPVEPSDLRRLAVSHWSFDGRVHEGVVLVHRDVAADMLTVFRSLFVGRYPIERLQPVDAYGGSDELSMRANNSSAFNCREVAGRPGTWSQHSFGRAIDLNPVQNPYVRDDTVLPEAGRRYLDRSSDDPAVIRAHDAVVQAFARIGWRWGGDWTSPKDYQHFSANGQ